MMPGAGVRIAIREELFVQGLRDDLVSHFCEENTFPNPKRLQMIRMFKKYLEPGAAEKIEDPGLRAKFKAKKRGIEWNIGKIPEKVTLWRLKDGWLALPRGYLDDMLAELDKYEVSYEVEERFPEVPELSAEITEAGDLFGYQEVALSELLQKETGVMESPTGSGKGTIIFSLIAELRVPTLIIVHTTELLRQTADRCKAWLGFTPGVIGGGKNSVKDITIAMIQTLNRMNIDKNHPIYNRFECVITDETHHICATTWADVMRRLPYRYKYGFTATAWRKDHQENIIFRILGPITAKVHHKDVVNAGKIVWPEVEFVYTDYWFDIEDDVSRWGQMITNLAADESRNRFISKEVRYRFQMMPDVHALILTDRIEHAEILAEMMKDLNPVLLTGSMNKSERGKSMELIRAGARLTIATVHLLGEGVDIPSWELLCLVSPFSGGPRTLQAVGRIARPAPGKDKALLVDFVDHKIRILRTAAQARARLYKSKGEK